MDVVKIKNWTYSFCTAFIDLRLSNTSVSFIIDKDLSFEAHWDIYVRNCQNDLDFWGILVLISISPVYYNKNLFNQVIRFVWQKQRVFTIKSSKSIFDLYAVWRKRKVFTKCDRGVKHAWNVLEVTCTCLVVTDLVSNHCYNYRYYLLTGMVVIIGATRRPVLIRFGDFWATFGVGATFCSLSDLQHLSNTRKSMISQKTPIYANFLKCLSTFWINSLTLGNVSPTYCDLCLIL